ncbi:MAG: hypothetical protein GX336_07315 [Halanaerobiaceae bacterium]|nr:hypothetical protein [Halanaerobiaceae bacterium]
MVAESLSTVFLLALIVEVLTNAIKAAFPFVKGGEEKNGSRITAAVVGIILCITTRVGILKNLNIDISLDILDQIITGIIISRGANAVHDLAATLQNKRLN